MIKELKKTFPAAVEFKHDSGWKIRNPHNRVKGIKMIFRFKLPTRDMTCKWITYIDNEIGYEVMAWAETKNFSTEDQVFFEPVAKSFTFEEKIPDFSALGDRFFKKE